jgi:serine/threonine protein kinase
VQLADFGATLARAATGGPVVDPEGAPWLSPEQAFGGLPPGVGSDIFSTALVVFFALTGRSYWSAFSAGGDTAAWAREIWAVRAPASVRAAELGSSLPPAWDIPFARALDVDPARRPRSITELADAFARAARGEPALDPAPISLPRFEVAPRTPPLPPVSPSAPTSPSFRTLSRARSTRTAWIAGSLGAAVLLGGAVVSSARLGHHPAPAPAPATTSTPPTFAASAAVVVPTPTPLPAAPPPSVAPTTPSPPSPPRPVPSTSATSSPSADPQMATLLVSCNPPCDSVWVDGHPAPDTATGKPMPPGVHMIGANLAHHPSKVQPVLLKRGEVTRFDVDFGR